MEGGKLERRVSVITKFDGLIFTLRDGDSNLPTVNSVQTLYRWAAIRPAGHESCHLVRSGQR